MTTKSYKLTSRIVAILLTFLFIALSIPFAFATEQTSLSETNVVSWPTIEGEIYWGQKLSDGFTISGGLVTIDGTSEGTVIPGKFEFINPDYIPTTTSEFADLKFIPDNPQDYLGFEVNNVTDIVYSVNSVTPVLVNENDPPVASSVSAVNARITTSSLTGGIVKNPYTGEVLNATWTWKNRRDKVTASGYFTAGCAAGLGYNTIYMDVYVSIAGDAPATKVETEPSFEEKITYEPDVTWGMLTLTGGKAVVSETGEEIKGTFAVSDEYKDKAITVGERTLPVIFTPNDATQGIGCVCQVSVKVDAGVVKFVDEAGNEIVPEITIDRVLEVGDDLNGYLKPYLNASCSFNYEETEGYGEKIKPGTHEYTVKTIIDDPNYERYGTLTFKIVLNKEKVNAKVKNVVGGKQIYIEGGDTYHLNGNFDVKYFIDGKEAGIIEDVEFNKPFEFVQNESGVYTYEIVYNGTEDDYYDITVITEAEDIKLQHQVKVAGQEPITYTYGEKVTVTAPAHEKPYYVFTGWGNSAFAPVEDDGEVVDTITFSMPDEDVELEATYEFSIKAFFEYIFSLIVDFFAKIAEFLQLQKVCDFFAGIFAV